uniref:Uncharacterized protein n=1 Tax=Nelumbo nucifera TaxID=4432 RepID=A0A822Y5C3_NELNU|nr:TPA_asm: hypothetical protein HUJ06_027997 [Nelumbo nucifera]
MDGHREEILLMDGSGNPLLTMRRKVSLSLSEFLIFFFMNRLSFNSSVVGLVFT